MDQLAGLFIGDIDFVKRCGRFAEAHDGGLLAQQRDQVLHVVGDLGQERAERFFFDAVREREQAAQARVIVPDKVGLAVLRDLLPAAEFDGVAQLIVGIPVQVHLQDADRLHLGQHDRVDAGRLLQDAVFAHQRLAQIRDGSGRRLVVEQGLDRVLGEDRSGLLQKLGHLLAAGMLLEGDAVEVFRIGLLGKRAAPRPVGEGFRPGALPAGKNHIHGDGAGEEKQVEEGEGHEGVEQQRIAVGRDAGPGHQLYKGPVFLAAGGADRKVVGPARGDLFRAGQDGPSAVLRKERVRGKGREGVPLGVELLAAPVVDQQGKPGGGQGAVIHRLVRHQGIAQRVEVDVDQQVLIVQGGLVRHLGEERDQALVLP